jgi:hypothetical protein
VRQLALAILAIVIGALVALAVTTAVLWPRPVSCGTGGGGVSNAEPVYDGGSVANATYQTVSFPASASVAFSWSTPNGTAANFRVVGPGGPTLYSATGPGGSGSFTIEGPGGGSENVGFGIGLDPANQTVDYEYTCTTLS